MTMDLIDTLDASLEQWRAGEPVSSVLARYPAQTQALLPLLEAATALEVIQPIEMPAPEVLLADQHAFLAEIAHLQGQAVSPGRLVRLKEWIAHRSPWPSISLKPRRKEQRRMSSLLVKATLVLGMIFGSTGGAAALAANSLPDSPIYPAKLAMEQVRLDVKTEPADRAALHLTLAQVRVREMERLALKGEAPDEPTMLRLQQHLDQAFHQAAQLPEDEMLDYLTQAGRMIENQEQKLQQVRARVAEQVQGPLGQANQILGQARQEVEEGLQDPQAFRWRHTKNRPPEEAPSQSTVVPQPGGNPDCPEGDCEPAGDQHQYGPQPGPGGDPDCPEGDCEPAGDQHQYGPQPGPGGNPDCPEGDCEPAGDQHQYDPQPGPDGNPDCPEGDCEPAGDQHQYGPQPNPDDNPDCPEGAACERTHDRDQDRMQPGPGGNPDCPEGGCEPVGDQHQYGPQPAQSDLGDGQEMLSPGPPPSAGNDDLHRDGGNGHNGGEESDGAKKGR